ncbi:MAG: FeoB-associated Cys-rich membrane protein [Flavobacteriaceae bacterium]|nr:FeoB-associated Cys-rich membrane protein [Flavobacteriaceae bacterium]
MENIQALLVILSGASALLFLFRKVLFKKKTTINKSCDSDCGCH